MDSKENAADDEKMPLSRHEKMNTLNMMTNLCIELKENILTSRELNKYLECQVNSIVFYIDELYSSIAKEPWDENDGF